MWMMIETRTAGAKGGRVCTTDSQKTVPPGTVILYHANIHKALKYAVKMDLTPFNPANQVERPKKQRYIADYYPDSAGHKADRLAHLSSCRKSCTPM